MRGVESPERASASNLSTTESWQARQYRLTSEHQASQDLFGYVVLQMLGVPDMLSTYSKSKPELDGKVMRLAPPEPSASLDKESKPPLLSVFSLIHDDVSGNSDLMWRLCIGLVDLKTIGYSWERNDRGEYENALQGKFLSIGLSPDPDVMFHVPLLSGESVVGGQNNFRIAREFIQTRIDSRFVPTPHNARLISH